MKQISKAFFFIGIVLLSSLTVSAQRYAYVDTDYILKNLESYQDAQKELDRISGQWQKEIEQRYEAIDRLYKAYQAEKVLLTEDMRKEREEEIVRQEEEAKSWQRQRFGVDGDLFRRREELIQPIQEEVFQAIKQVADGGGFSVIFDKAGQSNILYADPRYDKSDRVLSRLGVSANDRDGDDSDQDSGSGSETRQEENKGGEAPRR
jgi:outer membrane protein